VVKLFHGDCLEVMRGMADNSVDLVLTDPPYKITSRGGYTSAGGMLLDKGVREGEIFTNNSTDIKEYLPEFFRVLKEQGHCYIMVNNKNLSDFLSVISESDFHLIKTMVWAKDNKIMSQAYMSQFEFILFLRKGKFKKINNCGTSDLLQFKNIKSEGIDKKPLHYTEKPVGLMECLVGNSSNEHDIVLDPFLGIGSTGIACKKLNRDFIGIELDDKYFKIASERIAKPVETPLF